MIKKNIASIILFNIFEIFFELKITIKCFFCIKTKFIYFIKDIKDNIFIMGIKDNEVLEEHNTNYNKDKNEINNKWNNKVDNN